MSGFGKWYEEQQAGENGTSSSGSSWLMNMEEGLPLNFESIDIQANLQGFSFENMKQSMEAQMPKKILGMGYQQRFQVFCALLFLSALFFALAFFVGVPMMAVKPQKFALSFTCGSLMFMGSFGILKGPMEHLKSMCTADRMFFTTIYLGSMMATLYLTFTKGGARGYVLVMSASAVQLMALLWYLISFLPGGSAGLSIVAKIICTMLQPILKGCVIMQAKLMGVCVRYCCRRS
ncbi:unnamed protein product [Cylindrotheca closterium]|uniref:Vesicle transport protein n=1 Tax=Cylindrotheca closterium TaxID=2856 RepID=A0AAD2FP76_9STRA|nr:unnamed protein product [Cylindrotheca closterium]